VLRALAPLAARHTDEHALRTIRYSLTSVYVNFIPENEARVAEAYGPNYERLVIIKRRFDPSNLFRANQNVVPR
jgi:FAD/FMN-containing dehydrogenase